MKIKHPQVDTGLGFTCDESIVDLIKDFNSPVIRERYGLSTIASCQENTLHRTGAQWKKPRGYVSFTSSDPSSLYLFCYLLCEKMDTVEVQLEIPFDCWLRLRGMSAYLSFTPHRKVIERLRKNILETV